MIPKCLVIWQLCAAAIAVFASASDVLRRLTNEDNCGVAAISKSGGLSRIVNGTSSVLGQWPWQASIVQTIGGSSTSLCGGTLIQSRWVVTAAHCANGESISDISVLLGANDRTDTSETSRQLHSIQTITCHPSYIGESNHFVDDLCLLHLSSEVTFTTYVRPVCFPASGTTVNVGDLCVISGFGDTENTGDENILQYAQVGIINHTLCSSWYREAGVTIPEKHLCAGFEQGGTDSCQGDSGGPLVCPETVSGGNAYVLRGVTSFGLGCADVRRPGVYVSVAEYLDWMDEVIANSTGPSLHSTCHERKLLFASLVASSMHFLYSV